MKATDCEKGTRPSAVPCTVIVGISISVAESCPNYGAILKEDATVCEKCKQQIDTSDIKN
jgi:hypothetical protein